MYQTRNPRPNHINRYNHQRSVSMDGNDYIGNNIGRSSNRSVLELRSKGCHLCDDDDVDDDYNNNHHNGFQHNLLIDCQEQNEDDDGVNRLVSPFSADDERHEPDVNEDEVVKKIVKKIYEKMSNTILDSNTNANDKTGTEVKNVKPTNLSAKPICEYISCILFSKKFNQFISVTEDTYTTNRDIQLKINNPEIPFDDNIKDLQPIKSLNSNNPPNPDSHNRSLYEELLMAANTSSPMVGANSTPIKPTNKQIINNDTNNNMINGKTTKPELNENQGHNSSDTQSTKSESFEIDW